MPEQTRALPPGIEPQQYRTERMLRWEQFQADDDSGTHVVPMNDDRIHNCRSHCFCMPNVNIHGVWIHNAFDCRSEYEEGYRKLN